MLPMWSRKVLIPALVLGALLVVWVFQYKIPPVAGLIASAVVFVLFVAVGTAAQLEARQQWRRAKPIRARIFWES
jgi:O-antigen ligase